MVQNQVREGLGGKMQFSSVRYLEVLRLRCQQRNKMDRNFKCAANFLYSNRTWPAAA